MNVARAAAEDAVAPCSPKSAMGVRVGDPEGRGVQMRRRFAIPATGGALLGASGVLHWANWSPGLRASPRRNLMISVMPGTHRCWCTTRRCRDARARLAYGEIMDLAVGGLGGAITGERGPVETAVVAVSRRYVLAQPAHTQALDPRASIPAPAI